MSDRTTDTIHRAHHFEGRHSSCVAVRCTTGSPSPRYHLIVLATPEPVYIGLELPIENCARIAREFETKAERVCRKGNPWLGDSKRVRKILYD